jgi:polyisoprenoid-binding protein YceI
MKKICLSLIAFAWTGLAFAQSTWTIDRVHSKIGFSVAHMAISETEGKFNDFEGAVTTKGGEDFDGSDVAFTAKTASIDTDNERRDGHLKSADFFDAEKYPEVTFKGQLVKAAANKYTLKGDFTMHGTTKQVEFDVTYGGKMNTGRGEKAGFKLTGQVNRQDYGLTWNNKVATGEMVVGDMVDLIVKIELDKQVAPAEETKKLEKTEEKPKVEEKPAGTNKVKSKEKSKGKESKEKKKSS